MRSLGFSPRCHFNVEELSFGENVAFAIMIVLFESEKSSWSLRKCFSQTPGKYLKDYVFL